MRKITDIYEEYKIMPHLQMHQLRVAAITVIICDSLDIDIDKDTIIKASLIHDMGNVIKFDLSQTKSIFGLPDSEIEDIHNMQGEFIEKYGQNEHTATSLIASELSMSDSVIHLVSENRFSNLCIDKDGDDWKLKILHYSDGRVGPHGILSFDERMQDAGKRYENHSLSIDKKEHDRLVDCGKDIEKQIFAHSKIKPEDITDESVAGIIEELKNFEI